MLAHGVVLYSTMSNFPDYAVYRQQRKNFTLYQWVAPVDYLVIGIITFQAGFSD